MKATYIAAISALAILSGCVTPAKVEPYKISVPFDEAQAKRQIADGVNIVKGSGFMRQRGGGVVTCAGADVYLVPATEYAKARVTRLYGSILGGVNYRERVYFEPNPASYLELTKSTKCDAQGNFSFERVADGDFYVQTSVQWEVANSYQGGTILKSISVKNGQIETVILTGQ